MSIDKSIKTPPTKVGWMGFRLLTTSTVLLLFFILQKPLFMLTYHNLYAEATLTDYVQVIWHGLNLDLSVCAYLLILPTIGLFLGRFLPKVSLLKPYFAVISPLLCTIFIVDLVLYEYWRFRLDTTPIFYFLSSPKDAFASTSPWLPLLGVATIIILSLLLFKALTIADKKVSTLSLCAKGNNLFMSVATLIVCLAVEFIAIRGGFTVSTQNVGKVYFSNNTSINHAAINPVFSLLESASHENDFANQYRYIVNPTELQSIMRGLTDEALLDSTAVPAHTDTLLTVKRPNVVIVIMESFSAGIMQSLGSEKDVTPELDRIAGEGVLFTNFYANSFRTDRGLVSILSGFPAQPTTSLMKYPSKSQNLTSISKSLISEGYTASYYYGGDANFTNMRSYLMSQGYSTIISDHDFPASQLGSKWGAADEHVFNKAFDAISASAKKGQQLSVIQTSSSHEPFDVPYNRLGNKVLNAFAYTDHCIGQFINKMKQTPEWDNTIILLVADHLGCWPKNIDNFNPSRYHIPLIVTGGALAGKPRTIDVVGSQHDIAATLLSQMDIRHTQYPFSKDMLNAHNPHFAFFTVPDAFGMKTEQSTVIFDNKSQQTVYQQGISPTPHLQTQGQAYLQSVYDYISQL